MNKTHIPDGYSPKLNRYDTQMAIDITKQLFQHNFCKALSLKRVSAPPFVNCSSGCYKGNEVIGKIRAFQFQLNRENAEDFIKAFRPNQRLHSFDDITVEVWIQLVISSIQPTTLEIRQWAFCMFAQLLLLKFSAKMHP